MVKGGNEDWYEGERITARSPKAAITAYLELPSTKDQGNGQYAAVPLRSWKPVTVEVETKTALKFS
jgi:hypothetical protein